MKLITTFCCALFFFHLNAQGWDRTLTDSMRISNIAPTSDGGSVLLGMTSLGVPKIKVIKVDALGNLQWAKVFSDSFPVYGELFPSGKLRILQDSDGNYWFGSSNVSFGASQETAIVKLDKNGNKLIYRRVSLRSGEIHVLDNQLIVFGKNVVSSIATILRLNSNSDTVDLKTIPSIKFNGGPDYISTLQNNGLLIFNNSDTTGKTQTIKIGFDGVVNFFGFVTIF